MSYYEDEPEWNVWDDIALYGAIALTIIGFIIVILQVTGLADWLTT